MREAYTCFVCGYPLLNDEPRAKDGGGSYEICPSCGFQFGVSDDDEGFTIEEWRARWIAGGMRWQGIGLSAPVGWDPREQLRRFGR